MLRGKLDQRVDVAEADVIGAVGNQRHRGARAVALVERDLEAFGLEVTLVLREEEHPLRALVLPVQHQLDLGGLRLRRRGERSGKSDCRGQCEQRRRRPMS